MGFENNRKPWSNQEQILLRELYGSFGSKSWKKISKEFKRQGFRRNEIEIREKWMNHVDPQISKSDWIFEELQIIYRLFDQIGSKWSCIKKQIPGRTQVKIKNKFYTNLRVYIRFVVIYYEGKNCLNKRLINRIPPNILNQIYNGQNKFQFIRNQAKYLFKLMNFEINKQLLEDRLEQKCQLYQKFHKQLNEVFSEIIENHQFREMLENDESYYSEMESPKLRKMEKKGNDTSNGVLKQYDQNNDLSPQAKVDQAIENKMSVSEPVTMSPGWMSMMTLQPQIGFLEWSFYYKLLGYMQFMKE